MKLFIKNLLGIKEASIEINNLTIIAGENNTGKSTIGKALFSLISGINFDIYKARKKYIYDLLEDLKNIMRYEGHILIPLEEKIENLEQSLDYFLKKRIVGPLKRQSQNRYLSKIKEIEILIPQEIREKNQIINTILEKLKLAIKDSFIDEIKKENIYKTLNNTFFGDFVRKGEEETELKLSKKDGYIYLKASKDEIKLLEEKNPQAFKNFSVTFIETPFIFNIMNILMDSSLERKEYYPILKDLKDKLVSLPKKKNLIDLEFTKELKKRITEIIGGEIETDNLTGRFIYKRNNKIYQIENVASGIKSLGIILILLEKGYLTKNNVLILDEPEVHLHPKWQVEYGKILAELSKAGLYIIINTHSPYMVDILEALTKKENLRSSFYFAYTENNENKFKKLSVDNLEDIYTSLAEPIDKIIEEENFEAD